MRPTEVKVKSSLFLQRMHIRVAAVQLHSFFTSALDKRSTIRSADFTPGKESRYLFSRRLGELQSWSGLVENSKIFRPFQDSNSCSTVTKLTTILRLPEGIKRSAEGVGGHSEWRIENDPLKRKRKFIIIIIIIILPRVMKHYSPTGRRNHGRPLKRLLDTWDRNGSTSGRTPWYIIIIIIIIINHHLLYAGYSYSYFWDKLCP